MSNSNSPQIHGKTSVFLTPPSSSQQRGEKSAPTTTLDPVAASDKKTIPQCNPKILLVEDVLFIQKVSAAFLQELGCQVDAANNGTEAWTHFKANQYAMVILDIDLPDISGIEVARHIRATKKGQYIPLIAISANADSYKPACHKAGINAVFNKPVLLDGFHKILQQWLIGKQ